jgi:hypothetical protein
MAKKWLADSSVEREKKRETSQESSLRKEIESEPDFYGARGAVLVMLILHNRDKVSNSYCSSSQTLFPTPQ